MRAELSWRGRTGTVTVDGVERGRVHRAALRERGRAELAGAEWLLASRRGDITATGPDAARHTARGEGVLTRQWTLDAGPAVLRMDAAGGRGWSLVDVGTGVPVGDIRVRGMFAQRVEARLPADTPLGAVLLVLWVADVRSRRRAVMAGG